MEPTLQPAHSARYPDFTSFHPSANPLFSFLKRFFALREGAVKIRQPSAQNDMEIAQQLGCSHLTGLRTFFSAAKPLSKKAPSPSDAIRERAMT